MAPAWTCTHRLDDLEAPATQAEELASRRTIEQRLAACIVQIEWPDRLALPVAGPARAQGGIPAFASVPAHAQQVALETWLFAHHPYGSTPEWIVVRAESVGENILVMGQDQLYVLTSLAHSDHFLFTMHTAAYKSLRAFCSG